MGEKGSALYLCPGCGAFVSENASKCPKCGAALEGASEEEPLPEMEANSNDEADLELTLLEKEIAAEEDAPTVTLFMCSVCGAFTSSDAQICSNCGSPIDDEEAAPAEASAEANQDILEMLVLEDEEPRVEETEDNIIDYLKKLENAEDVETFLKSVSDDVGALELPPPKELLPERSEESDDILSKLIESNDKVPREIDRAGTMQTVEELLSSDEIVPRVNDDNDTIALCRNCGAFVSETASVCKICGEALAGRKFSAEIEQAAPDIEVDEKQADSIMRKMLGVNIDAPLDTSAGRRFQEDGSLGLCTVCGAFISQEAETCPVCGTHIEEMPEFIPSLDIAEPEQEEHGLAICPHCGVFVQEGARECLSCVKPIPEGATVPISAEADKPEEPDRAVNLLKTFLGVERALEMAPVRDKTFSGLDMCPDCGAFVSMDAVVCGICGSPLFEDAEDMLDIDRQIGELELPKCPMCGSNINPGSESCASCGLSFTTEEKTVEEQEQDVTDFLDTELEATISRLESIERPDSPEVKEEMNDLADLLVIEDEGSEVETELEPLATLEEPIEVQKAEIIEAEPEFEQEIEPHERVQENPEAEESMIEAAEPEWQDETETLEFIGPLSEETEPEVEDYEEEPRIMETPTPSARPAVLPSVDTGKQPSIHAANWTTGVYVSVATLCFFLIFYAIAPGDYAPGLAVIFGTLLVIGIYLLATEKSLFFKGDLKHASVFLAGLLVASVVLLHWPAGFLTPDSGFEGQPAADRIMIGISVLLTSVGLLWIRARIRFVFTWFFGNTLLLLSSIVSFAHSNYGAWLESPVLLVAGFGSTLIVLSLIFLQYERAISTSIETDVVRGDAHYLKRNYAGAIESYDDALSKAQMKKVEVLGSPIVQYDVPWYSKGSALIFMGQIEEGLKCLDMALAINPCNEVTWVNKGNAHSKLGQHELAMECYTKAIECNPFYEIAWNNLGNVHARQKDYLGALKNYNRAIKINPRYDDAWINKGYVLAKMGKREQAVKCLNHVGSRAKGAPQPIDKDVHLL